MFLSTRGPPNFNTEAYDRIDDNPFRRVTEDPLSTFSIDVDTASYANVRRFLNDGPLPPTDAVRIEELVNYFPYDYPQPAERRAVLGHDRGRRVPVEPDAPAGADRPAGASRSTTEQPPPRNLVFLIDVSARWTPPNKLPLREDGACGCWSSSSTENDRVAIVVYAGAAGLVLPSTRGDRQGDDPRRRSTQLEAGGSTNGGAGIQLAYDIAAEHFIKGGINRVILATDGDFNVGVTNQGDLDRLIEAKRDERRLPHRPRLRHGQPQGRDDGEARRQGQRQLRLHRLARTRRARCSSSEMGATLVTIAKDVKIQVEFNPAKVGAYRLIGYENRLLRNAGLQRRQEGRRRDRRRAHVTALYEIVPPGEDDRHGRRSIR